MTTNVLLLYDTIDAFQVRRLAEALTGDDRPKAVTLHIHSPGGDVLSGFALYHLLKKLRSEGLKVTTVVDGLAASMASVVALAGDTVQMSENARLLLHNPWALAEGDSAQLAAHAEELQRVQDELLAVYAERATIPKEALQVLMNEERYLGAQEARRLGLIDSIVPAVMALGGRKKERLRPLALYQAYHTAKSTVVREADAAQAKLQAAIEQEKTALAVERHAFQAAKADWLVTQAVDAGKVPAAAKAALEALAGVAFNETAALLETLEPKTKAPTLTALLEHAPADSRSEWDVRTWEKQDPKGLAHLKATDPARYQALFQATYGNAPASPAVHGE